MIQILTGPIRSHKTTTLKQWVEGRNDCGGVLTPDVGSLRQLYNVKDGRTLAWQKSAADAPGDLLVGRFVFDGNAFQQATTWLDEHLEDPEVQYLILDEVGPLELSGKGWDGWLAKALASPSEKEFILVVRDGLVEKVVGHYDLVKYEVVDKRSFQ